MLNTVHYMFYTTLYFSRFTLYTIRFMFYTVHHCYYFKKSGKCDMCGHMVERREVFSSHFKVKHAIAGRNIHPPASQKQKLQWFVYLEECLHPYATFQYVGSTNSFTHRWSNTKSIINSMQTRNSVQPSTGLEKHFKQGCSQYSRPDLIM